MQAFSKSRNIDAQTICDLSMQNYVEVWYVLHIVFWELFIYSWHLFLDEILGEFQVLSHQETCW